MSKLKCKLLLVEDNAEEIERFRRSTIDENEDRNTPLEYELIVARTRDQALAHLEENQVDCAVVDLRIPASENDVSNSLEGNAFLQKTLVERAIPIVVHSGYTAEVSDEIIQYNVKTVDKIGGEYPEIFSWFSDHAPLFAAMQSFRRRLMGETALIFQKSILPHWKESEKFVEGDDDFKKVIFRQIVAHLAEQLSLPIDEAPEHHLNEVYFRPPLRENRLHTGDVVQYNNAFHVIVTPQCNIANDYPDNFLLAKCRNMDVELDDLHSQLEGGNKSKLKAKRKISDWANQNISISQHFLPPCGDEGPWIVDFKSIVSVPKDDAYILLESRIAGITPQFIPNLIQRFAAYLGRQGQPNLNAEELEIYLQA